MFIFPVPDRRVRNIPEVILVRRWAVGVLGIWRGRVWVKGGAREGQFTSNLQVSRRGYKGEERGSSKGRLKARGVRHV